MEKEEYILARDTWKVTPIRVVNVTRFPNHYAAQTPSLLEHCFASSEHGRMEMIRICWPSVARTRHSPKFLFLMLLLIQNIVEVKSVTYSK